MKKNINLLIEKTVAALANAYAPYSNFRVGCTVQSETGDIYTGVNVENGSYSLTVCAETNAICQLIAAGKKEIKDVVILSDSNIMCTPCGACRQRIAEFATKDTIIYLCNKEKVLKQVTIDELLPFAFTLDIEGGKNNA